MKSIKVFVFLFFAYILNATAQDTLRVGISIPELSGLAFITYDDYWVQGDSMFYGKSYPNILDSIHTRKVTTLKKYKIDLAHFQKLKEAVSKIDLLTDTLLEEFDCEGIDMGWSRFIMGIGGKNGMSVLVANVYREKYYNVVDVFNEIWMMTSKKKIIQYDKEDLLKREKDCNGKLY